MHDTDAAKRIPKSLNTDTSIVADYSVTDLTIALFPAVVVVVLTRVLVPSGMQVQGVMIRSVTLPLAGIGVVVGVFVVYLTPAYTDSTSWVLTVVGSLVGDSTVDHESARTQPRVRRLHPDAGAIERMDGAMVGMVQVDSPTMGLATAEEWSRKADSFEDFVNTTVEFPIQLYSTTEAFPVDEYVQQYEQRLDDPDVEANPQLQSLIDAYVDWYRTELGRRQMTIRDHYVIVAVRPTEVQFDDASFAQRLADIPYLGLLVEGLHGPSRVEQQAAMFDTLADRLHRVERGIRDIEGCSAHRLDVGDAAGVLREFWTGEQAGSIEGDCIRTTPLVGGDSRE